MKKILIIEDDATMRRNIAELVELYGYEVKTAENGKIGIEKTRSFKPNLIICDVMMPELDGNSVLHILHQKPETASIPFIFLSARSEKEDLRKGMALGADDYLFKPFDSTELLNAIELRLKKIETLKEQISSNDFNTFIDEAQEVLSLDGLKEEAHSYKFEAKEFIYKQDEYPQFVYYIESGKIKTFRYTENGKEYITEILDADSFFGYQAVFEDRSYNEIAECLAPTSIIKISKDNFMKLIYHDNTVAQKFIQLISKNLSDKEEELMHMAYSSVRKRVSRKLKELLSHSDEITILRTDLAKLTGTTKETLTRTLTEFKEENIIDSIGKKIILKDRDKLNRMEKYW